MQIGIMAKTFSPPTLVGTLDAVAAHGLSHMQYNFTCTGLPDMPDKIDPEICDRIREEIAKRGMTMAAISGTYNMIHPDMQENVRTDCVSWACWRPSAIVLAHQSLPFAPAREIVGACGIVILTMIYRTHGMIWQQNCVKRWKSRQNMMWFWHLSQRFLT